MILKDARVLTPVIKRSFVNPHVEAVRAQLGDAGVAELEKRSGVSLGGLLPLVMVPVAERILLSAVVLLDPDIDREHIHIEAGKVQLDHFADTVLGRMILSTFSGNPMPLIKGLHALMGHIYDNTDFRSVIENEREAVVTIYNNGYHQEHFIGFFSELIRRCGLHGSVFGTQIAPSDHQYAIYLDTHEKSKEENTKTYC